MQLPSLSNILRIVLIHSKLCQTEISVSWHSFYFQRIQKRKSIFREPGKYLDRGKYFSKISSHVGYIKHVSFSTHGNLSPLVGFWSSWKFYSPIFFGKIRLGVNSILKLLTRAGTIFFNVFGVSQISGFPSKRVNNIKIVYRKSILIFSILMMSMSEYSFENASFYRLHAFEY